MSLIFSTPAFTDNIIRALSWTLIHSLWQGMIYIALFGFGSRIARDRRIKRVIEVFPGSEVQGRPDNRISHVHPKVWGSWRHEFIDVER